jgi:hypothetical protein
MIPGVIATVSALLSPELAGEMGLLEKTAQGGWRHSASITPVMSRLLIIQGLDVKIEWDYSQDETYRADLDRLCECLLPGSVFHFLIAIPCRSPAVRLEATTVCRSYLHISGAVDTRQQLAEVFARHLPLSD